ncbi:hypothetical protein BT96DRAFT_1004981 [Gymnopus androsaceus JB14]|uniref:Uncharacterized protein n=1 Tax=Gymnopus androsaceus JB14 TaxID=1447944 RepID=A0A6A4GQN7_9AGAR|nr:hypothetical protein BT96DRAFT_1004981 [Gymnopus androsaceus JB14]
MSYLDYWCSLDVTGSAERETLMVELDEDERLVDCLIDERRKRHLEIAARLAPIEREIYTDLCNDCSRRGVIVTPDVEQRLREAAHDKAVIILQNKDQEHARQRNYEQKDRIAQLRLERLKAIKEGTYQRPDATHKEDQRRISETIEKARFILLKRQPTTLPFNYKTFLILPSKPAPERAYAIIVRWNTDFSALIKMRNALLALKTWHFDGGYRIARYPRDADGELVPPLNILDHVDLQCEHISPPRIFTDPDTPEQVYAVCAERRAARCDYLICVSDVYRRVRVLGDVSYVLPQSQNDLLALRTWHIDGEYLARYPRDANGEPVPPLNILDYKNLQCEHISPPRIFTDPNTPEQIYAVCASALQR